MVEQMLVRNLPVGFKARLRARAKDHAASMEAEARAILVEALDQQATTIVDILAAEDDIDLIPEKVTFQPREVAW